MLVMFSQLVNRLLADALGVVAKSDDALEDFSYEMLRKKHLKLSRELISLEKQCYSQAHGRVERPTRNTTLIHHITGKSQKGKTN